MNSKATDNNSPVGANIVACPSCGHGCSREAKVCPSCGHPKPGFTLNDHFNQFESRLFLLFVVINFLVWLFASFDKFLMVLVFSVLAVAALLLLAGTVKAAVNWRNTVSNIAFFILCGPGIFLTMIAFNASNYWLVAGGVGLGLLGLGLHTVLCKLCS